MLLGDVGLVRQYLSNSPVFEDRIWSRPAEQVTSFDLTLFRGRMSAIGLAAQGDQAVARLQEEALSARVSGQLQVAPFLTHVLTEPRFMLDELLGCLMRLTLVRRQACLLALEEGLELEVVAGMTWTDVLQGQAHAQLAIDILRERNRCRHIKLSYVFWEFATPSIAAPLLKLEKSVEDAFERPWEQVRREYRLALKVDGGAEAASFFEVLAATAIE